MVMTTGSRRRPSMGRQKIEIRRIASEEARQVCFSKRRAGLFKKASELSILCGADVAAVVFSPAGKAYSFGHPSVESIVDRFFHDHDHDSSSASPPPPTGGGGGRAVAELNRQYGELRAMLDAEKARKERVEVAMEKERAEGSPVAAWIEMEVGGMGQDELLTFAASLSEVQAVVSARADQMLRDALMAGRRSRQGQLLGGAGFDLGAFVGNGNVIPPGFAGAAGMQLQMHEGFGNSYNYQL